MNAPQHPVRWGIAGTGSISQQMAADFALTGNSQTIAVSSRNVETAGAFAETFGIALPYGRYDDLLADGTVEAVYIGTPHATHYEMAKRTMEAGKHVLCEKPVTLNSDELADLLAAAKAAGVFFMEAMWMKFNPTFVSLRELLDSGEIGEVRSVRAAFGLPFPHDDSSRWKAELFGSTLLDQGIYPITLAEMLLGSPDEARARGVVRPDGVDLTEHITFDYTDGRFAQLAASMVEFIDLSASINGTRGWVTIPGPFWPASEYTVHRPSADDFRAERRVQFERHGNGYVPMLRAVSTAIRDGLTEHPLHTWDDSARVFAILDEVSRQIGRK